MLSSAENNSKKHEKKKKSSAKTPSGRRGVNRALQPGGDAAIQPGKGKGHTASRYDYEQLDANQERLGASVREAAFNDDDRTLVELLGEVDNGKSNACKHKSILCLLL